MARSEVVPSFGSSLLKNLKIKIFRVARFPPQREGESGRDLTGITPAHEAKWSRVRISPSHRLLVNRLQGRKPR